MHEVERAPQPRVSADGYPSLGVERGAEGVPSQAPWWTDLHDPFLASLIEEALSGNLDVAEALARVDAARALARAEGAPLRPVGELVGERTTSSFGDDVSDLDDDWLRTREASLRVTWELDLFGRLRARRDAALEDAAAALDDLHAVRLVLSADVADAYLAALEQRLTVRLLDEQIRLDSTLLELTELRFAQGGASAVDVLQQRGQLAATRSLMPAARAEQRLAENRIDVLLGGPPDGVDRVTGDGFPPLAALPAVGMPGDLLVRRPDLRARMRRLVGQDHRVAEAVADRLPRIVLGGALGYRDDDVDAGLLFSLAGSLVQPLFDGGERVALADEARAEYEALAAAFASSFLAAVEEVDGALYREERQREEVLLLRERAEVLEENVREARIRYANGLTDYLPVLVAVEDVHATQRQLLTSERELLGRRVTLHRALGGSLEGDS